VSSTDVARYYDSNTRRFLLMGGGRGAYAMHRELWGPGIGSAREASSYIDRVLGDEIATLAPSPNPVVVDFGCGVGGTLFHLAERFPGARLRGITVSPRQVEIAQRFARELGYADRCSFFLGDFQSADLELRADAVVAVESFAHSTDPDAFLSNVAKHLRPGGCLLVADDFLALDEGALDARQRHRVAQFQAGWRVPAACVDRELMDRARTYGLEVQKNVDLTALTRPGSRVRDRLTAAACAVLAPLGLSGIPFFGNLIGGNALQVGLRDGFLQYRLLLFRKRPQ